VIVLIALAICGASIVAIDWGLYHLIRTGTCASGGPYVSARPCPPGTGLHILALILGIFGGLIGIGVFAARGRADSRHDSPVPLGLVMWSLLFCTIALSGLYAALGPAAGDDAPKGTAIFLAALFIPMGLAPLPLGAMGRRKQALADGRAAAADPAAVADPAAAAAVADPAAAAPVADPAAAAVAAVAADPAAAIDADGDPLAKIEKLGELRDKGLITEAEFEIQKQRLLREV